MKKFLIALAAAAALSLAGGATQVHAEKTYEYLGNKDHGGGWKSDYWLKTDEDIDGIATTTVEIQLLVKLFDSTISVPVLKFEIPIWNPDPFGSAPYDYKHPGDKESNPLVLGKPDPIPAVPTQKLAAWQQQIMDLMGGFSPQGKGGNDDVINPDPFGSTGDVPKAPKAKPKVGLDPDHIGQKLGEMEELLTEQFPGLGIDFTNVAYIQLHNPAESQSPGGKAGGPAPGDGGGPPPPPGSAAEATSSDKAGGKAPPNIKDAAMGALVNPEHFAKGNLPGPQGNMGLPGALGGLGMPGPGASGQPGGAGGSFAPPLAVAARAEVAVAAACRSRSLAPAVRDFALTATTPGPRTYVRGQTFIWKQSRLEAKGGSDHEAHGISYQHRSGGGLHGGRHPHGGFNPLDGAQEKETADLGPLPDAHLQGRK